MKYEHVIRWMWKGEHFFLPIFHIFAFISEQREYLRWMKVFFHFVSKNSNKAGKAYGLRQHTRKWQSDLSATCLNLHLFLFFLLRFTIFLKFHFTLPKLRWKIEVRSIWVFLSEAKRSHELFTTHTSTQLNIKQSNSKQEESKTIYMTNYLSFHFNVL